MSETRATRTGDPFAVARYSRPVRIVRRITPLQYGYERWKNRGRRKFIKANLPTGGVGAELGVHKGYFSEVLLHELAPRVLYLVDPWYLLGPTWEWSGGNRSTSAALARVIRRFGDELAARSVVLRIGDDLEFLESLGDDHLDWAYIDSSHEYEHTMAELELLQYKVRPGGVIAGDDWRAERGHRHHGVARAVSEFARATGYEITYVGSKDHQWAIRRIAAAA